MKSCEEHVGGLTLVTISDIGSNHRALLIPNQDAADYCIDGDDFVLAVSDGVGSCAKAEIGSRNAVTACVQLFLRRKMGESALHTDSIADEIIDEWRALLGTEKEDECCATLKAIFKIGQVIKAVSVGDGFVAISCGDKHIISPAEQTAFTNETTCLCSTVKSSDFWVQDFQLASNVSYAAICCTDGVANGIVDGQELNLLEDIEKNTRTNTIKADLEALLLDIAEYCFDDKTVGVVKYER